MLPEKREYRLIIVGVLGLLGIGVLVRGCIIATKREQPELPGTVEERIALAVKLDGEALAAMTKEQLDVEFRTRRENHAEAVRQNYGVEGMAASLQRAKDEYAKRGLKEPK